MAESGNPESNGFDHAAASVKLDAERLLLVCRAMVRTPLGVLPASAFVAYTMAPHVGAWRAWGWMAVVLAIWSVRAAICGLLLRHPPPLDRIRFWIRYIIVSGAVSGMAGGSAAVLFSSAPQLESAFLTMVICGWSAAGLAVSGAVPAAFYGFIVFFLTPITLTWAFSGDQTGLLVATLLVLFLVLLITHARDSAELVGRALRVGYENEELARRLRAREAEAQAARERAEAANLSKSMFLAAASHDLRQPLHALSLLLFSLQERMRDPEVTDLLKKMATSADSLDSLFKGLLDLSRLDAGSVTPQLQAVALDQLLRRLENDFRPLAEAKGLQFNCAASDAWVESDAEMLERVLRNLLDNAVKYTERGRIDFHLEEEPHVIRMMICDTGIGIDVVHRERVFEEYFQIRNPARNRSQGIGLGLAIVKRMCDLLGHSIRVHSEPGQGSTFEVTLPRGAAPASGTRESERSGAPSMESLRGLVVVVVEDDVEVREAMRTLLEGWQCRPVVGASGEEVLDQLESQRLRPDAVVADHRLAGPESGLGVISNLCRRYGDIPAAIATGEIDPAELKVPEDMSVVIMQKPVRASDIRDWLLLWKSVE
jgi:two-component system, sensor histidine kinase